MDTMFLPGNPAPARIHRGVHLVVALALLGAAVAALPIIRAIPAWGAILLGFAALTGVLWTWWSRNPSALPAVSFSVAAVTTFILSDILLGFPLVMLATIVMQIQFGRRVGWWFAGGLCLLFGVGSFVLQPAGGALSNTLVLGIFLLLGVLVGHLITELQRAHATELRLARDAALRDLDRALADERLQQARALHDDLGQQLTLITMGLELAGRQRPSDAAWDEVARTAAVAQEALTTMRRQVRALSLTAMEEPGVGDALESLVSSFAGTGLDVAVERSGRVDRADTLAYRIIQEGLTNVVRHTDADRVGIQLQAGEQMLVRVTDNGRGTGQSPPEGFGLAQLRARVEAAGGTLEADSTPGGFVLAARYPLPEDAR